VKQIYRWDNGTWQIGQKYGMLTGTKKIDWEYKLLMGEGIIFASLFLFLPIVMLLSPKFGLFVIISDFAVLTMLSTICALYEGRSDVLFSLPTYELLRFVDCSVFLYSFWKTIIRRKQVRGWFAVKRY
jgi:hypothetical protein